MGKYKVDKEYDVDHARKGKFRVRLTTVDSPLVLGVITRGTAHYLSEDDREVGDTIALDTNRPFIKLTPVGQRRH